MSMETGDRGLGTGWTATAMPVLWCEATGAEGRGSESGKSGPVVCRVPELGGRRCLVLGLGATGVSVVRYLRRAGARVRATDADPERAEQAAGEWVAPVEAGRILTDIDLLVVSPGVPLDTELVIEANRRGIEILGDIELFARAISPVPVIAVTGTNGKSTVASLTAAMAAGCGRRVAAGANLGRPALDLLDPTIELYVLELSSFQLELTHSLAPLAATVLNVSPDHLDRYRDLAAYAAAKATIFRQAGVAIVNREDSLVREMVADRTDVVSFGLDEPVPGHYGLRRHGGAEWLCRGDECLLAASEVPLAGRHNLANVLAAWALAATADIPDAAIARAVRDFHALPHRLAFIAERHGVRYLDDSKATNVSAACASLTGLADPLVVIAGGQGKGQNFAPFAELLAERARAVILIGTDAPQIGHALAGRVPTVYARTMPEAVGIAAALAERGDRVVLAPACASLDQYRDYNQRGEAFAVAVEALNGD